jgi:hypothetical protein
MAVIPMEASRLSDHLGSHRRGLSTWGQRPYGAFRHAVDTGWRSGQAGPSLYLRKEFLVGGAIRRAILQTSYEQYRRGISNRSLKKRATPE